MQEKQLELDLFETHWNSSNLDIFYVFLLFYENLTILIFLSWNPMLFPVIQALTNLLSMLCFYYI